MLDWLKRRRTAPRIAIVSGKHLRENPYRDVRLLQAFQEHGAQGVLILPGQAVNSFGYCDEDARTQPFAAAGALWINSLPQYMAAIQRVDAVAIGCWKQNKWLVRVALALGKLVVEYDSTGGFDHWAFGSHALLVKGPFSERLAAFQIRSALLPDMVVKATGSITYEQPPGWPPHIRSREEFLARYELDPSRKTAVFFPKSVKLFEAKLKSWFPDQGADYNDWYMTRRAAICEAVKRAGFNLIIKLHPSAYASYRSQRTEEYDFWRRFPWARPLDPEDALSCYAHLDVGIGIVSHSALDLGFWRRPFVYVESDAAPLPDTLKTMMTRLGGEVPPGPSLGWEDTVPDSRPFHFPSWVGTACSSDQLADVLADGVYCDPNPDHYNRFISEFWYQADGRSSERIAEYVLERLEDHVGHIHPKKLATAIKEAWQSRSIKVGGGEE